MDLFGSLEAGCFRGSVMCASFAAKVAMLDDKQQILGHLGQTGGRMGCEVECWRNAVAPHTFQIWDVWASKNDSK